jgi:gliding motility-associated-like protein
LLTKHHPIKYYRCIEMKKLFVLTLLFNFFWNSLLGQYQIATGFTNTATVSGACYTLTTQTQGSATGVIWSNSTLDLNCNFTKTFNMKFSASATDGADGVCFIMKNIPNYVPGATGNGGALGFAWPGNGNSFAIEFDTYVNDASPSFDPGQGSQNDHIAFLRNGSNDHSSANNLAGPLLVGNLENGAFHPVTITWIAATLTLTCTIDAFNLTSVVNLPTILGSSTTYFGFAGATGGLMNLQQVCPLPSVPTVLPPSTENICPGTNFTLDATVIDLTNTNNFSWTITAGPGTITTPNPAQTGIIDVTGSGVGTVIQMTYTDNCGLVYTRIHNVQPSATPTVTVANLSICAGSNWTLTPTGGNYTTLTWDITAGSGSSNPPVNGTTFSGTGAATVEVTPAITGCASAGTPVTVTISETSLIPFDAGNNVTFCTSPTNLTYTHSPASITTQAGFPITWSVEPGNTGNIVSSAADGTLVVDQTGTYTLTATGGPGCVVTDNVYIELVTNPTVTIVPGGINNDENICPGETMPLNVVGNFDHVTWSTGDLDINTTNITAAGNYSVEIAIGTCTATDNITITESPAIVPSAGGDQLGICTNGNITLNGSTEPTYTAAWTITSPTGNIVSGQSTTDPVVSSSGTYMITVTNPEGCTANASAVVDLLPVPIINLGNNFQVCANIPFNITLNNTNCPNLNLVTSVLWSDNTTINTFSSQVAPNGSNTITVTLNINTCAATDNIVVSAFVPPLWDLGPTQTVCGDQPFVINSTENVSWATSANSTITTGTSYTQNNPSPGTESLTATLTYGNGCIIFDNLDIDIVQPFTVNLPATADFCEGSAIQIDAGNTVTWSNGDVGQTTMANEVGLLTATYTDGPCTSQDQMTITMTYLPNIEWTDNTTYCEGTTVTLGAPGSHATSFYWSTGETTETIIVSESGYYSLTASNSCATVNRDIVLDFEICDAYAFIPNTFTPDKDGINEVWQPIIYNAKSYEVFIYNRWGDIIYHSNDPEENWLGEAHEGQHYVQDGVYSYRLILESPQREKKEYFGYFRMLR